jgi:hypothetical protein
LVANADKLPKTVKDSLTSMATPAPMSHAMTK